MKAANAMQMRKIDSEAEAVYGIPGIVLMENAGIKVYNRIIDAMGASCRVCFICGKGNNGGDGFVAARHLYAKNRNIVVYAAGEAGSLRGNGLINYNIVKRMGLDIRHITDEEGLESFKEDVKGCGILVDGLLGTGLKGGAAGLYGNIIDIANEYAPYIISIDIPSGVDSDCGRVLGKCIKAHETVTFGLPKVGLYMFPGSDYAGRIFIEDISIPEELINSQSIDVNIINAEDIKHIFKKRKRDAHKGTYGRAFIAAGSKHMSGAAAMCIRGALRSGAGIVEAGVPRSIRDSVASGAIEAIVRGMEEEEGHLSSVSFDKIYDCIKGSDSYALGPGLSKWDSLAELMERVIGDVPIPGVIDADGLNVLAGNAEMLYNAKGKIILTPHPGEMARLTGKALQQVQQDRIGCAVEFSGKYNVIVVLKGAHTIVSSPDGQVYINTTGNPGMSKGGSGDVLTGIIASLLAQGIEPIEAAKASVYVHGLAGDMASEALGEYGMKAGDIIDFLPAAIKAVSI